MATDGVRDFRPRIHFTPAKGWMNDPNGLFWDGRDYHLYYQHNPHDAVWGPMYWGAATSRDLLRWRRETTRSSSPRAT